MSLYGTTHHVLLKPIWAGRKQQGFPDSGHSWRQYTVRRITVPTHKYYGVLVALVHQVHNSELGRRDLVVYLVEFPEGTIKVQNHRLIMPT